ncbi:hypothetical protein OESDEN_06591 [Oesophagostomum dentatum]|uniref:Uncharacterized protein n=1 Tax=Oesophagostomum dentatum TaxID=61180 RepID=A0A0B1T8C6_OESDE|nr:hypothetical protein OESDEN_06591 [Oesophagostomum dentatum]
MNSLKHAILGSYPCCYPLLSDDRFYESGQQSTICYNYNMGISRCGQLISKVSLILCDVSGLDLLTNNCCLMSSPSHLHHMSAASQEGDVPVHLFVLLFHARLLQFRSNERISAQLWTHQHMSRRMTLIENSQLTAESVVNVEKESPSFGKIEFV